MTEILRNATLADVPGISHLLTSVSVNDDPEFQLMVASKIVPKQELIEYIIQTHTHPSVITNPCSLVIESTSSGEIIGFRLSEPYPNIDTVSLERKLIEKSTGLKKRHCFFADLDQGITDPNNAGISFLQLTIAPNYRKKGLATQLVIKSIYIAKNSGVSFIKVCAASEYSCRIFERLGFQKISEIDYKTYEQNGIQFFDPSLISIHSRIVLYLLSLI
ncbi:MAG: GNAT family N-acetyltransferase [Moorea sp. SIO3I7]|uniref:GNAT family N-acetyltransferase n=1 Tax=Moorena sp. SIO3I8 TaxID=2607833 RepID=UPI0013C131E2|nr:GNAT family N-acetyltransferase [Moorena sp. SIO3I8]NEN94133.1 GNAT family N-acetyltransferase [Moorena sp. SIO3I7]NEO05763.1 GNAT family N-acetyltransferase [Moorena sp. SIO3I8]